MPADLTLLTPGADRADLGMRRAERSASYTTQLSVGGAPLELPGPASHPPILSISHASQTLNLITINPSFPHFTDSVFRGVSSLVYITIIFKKTHNSTLRLTQNKIPNQKLYDLSQRGEACIHLLLNAHKGFQSVSYLTTYILIVA